jgi:hypothetical protein
MDFEHRSDPLLPRRQFIRRVLWYATFSFVLLGISLGIGVIGYHYLDGLSWLDSFLNASMILAGMGPVDPIRTDSGKWFASFYAVFSGVVFLSTVAVFLSPIAHRFLHKLHLGD